MRPGTVSLCLIAVLIARSAFAQGTPQGTPPATPTDAGSVGATTTAAALLTKLDQLIEKNQQLEKENRELLDEINALRQVLAQAAAGSPTTPNAANTQTGGGTAQASAAAQSDDDDKTLLAEASAGNPAIFGEFNPG